MSVDTCLPFRFARYGSSTSIIELQLRGLRTNIRDKNLSLIDKPTDFMNRRECHEVQHDSSRASSSAKRNRRGVSPIDQLCHRNSSLPKKQRKLILHVDLRNTVIVADSVTNVSIEQAINSYLTGVLWGREVNGTWIWVSKEPSLAPPESDTMTYYKYLEGKLVTTPEDRATLMMATGDFTRKEIGARFRPIYEKYLPMLKWNDSKDKTSNCDENNTFAEATLRQIYDQVNLFSAHSNSLTSCDGNTEDSGLETDVHSRSVSSLSSINSFISVDADPTTDQPALTMTLEKNGQKDHYHYILPSFVKFLRFLCEQNRDFVILLRTYGWDAPNVLSSIKRIFESSEHPLFPEPRLIPVFTTPGSIKRSPNKDTPFVMSFHNTIRRNISFKNSKISRTQFNFPLKVRSCRKPLWTDSNSQRKFKKRFFSNTFPRIENCWSVYTQKRNGPSYKHLRKTPRTRYASRPWKNQKDHSICCHNNNFTQICTEDEIYETLNNLERGVYGFEDDFKHWQDHDYNRLAGKPFWIALEKELMLNQNDDQPSNHNELLSDSRAVTTLEHFQGDARVTSPSNIHHIFFDDNIRVNNENSIVDVRLYDDRVGCWRSSNPKETELCKDVFLVQADLLESIENENYFIKKLEICEKNLDDLLFSSSR